MTILGFDTSTSVTAVGLITDDGEALEFGSVVDPGLPTGTHTNQLLPLVEQALASGGVTLVDEIAVGVGPGSYTGMRIAVAAARGFAQALDLAIKPVSTLQALAIGAIAELGSVKQTLAVIDARRGEVFCCIYGSSGEAVGSECVVKPDAVSGLPNLDLKECVAVGEGSLKYQPELEQQGITVAPRNSTGHTVHGIAVCQASRRVEPVPINEVLPKYLRLPDAELTLKARESKV